MNTSAPSRRSFLQASTFTAVAASLGQRLEAADAASGLKGKINHSACKWCYAKTPFEELCRAGKEMGLTSIDLVDPADFEIMKKYGLTSAMISYPSIAGPKGEKVGSIPFGFNNPGFHDLLIQAYEPGSRPARTLARNTSSASPEIATAWTRRPDSRTARKA
jgi:hypothetical protein